jgi:hypothetical protein
MAQASVTTLSSEGTGLYPTLAKIYEFFSPRSSKLTIWSFGLGVGGIETDFVESTGSKVCIFDARPEARQTFATMERVLLNHTAESDDPAWAAPLATKWISPAKLTLSSVIPFSHNGKIVVNGVETACAEMSVDSVPQVDICKIEYPGLTYQIVYTLLTTGYRPGLMYIRWDEHPDENVSAMLCAGHLQTAGYTLMATVNGFFLYRYVDECCYDTCSWARTDCMNPMVAELTSKSE